MDIDFFITELKKEKLTPAQAAKLCAIARFYDKPKSDLVERVVEVPLYGVLKVKCGFSVNMTDNQIIDSVIKTFNGKNQQVKAVKKMNEGVSLLYDLSFARVLK